MKGMILLLSLTFCSTVIASTYYVAPWGDDDGLGTFKHPWATWQKAIRTARAGDTVFFRGGIYYTTSTQSCVPPAYGHSGTRDKPICYFNYPSETPILDGINCTTPKSGLTFQGEEGTKVSNIHLRGLHVRNFNQINSSGNPIGIGFAWANNIIIEQCVAYNIGMKAFQLFRCDTVWVLNCDAYNVCDSNSTGYAGGGGDGFLAWDHQGSPSIGDASDSIDYIVYKGCRAWNCSDDGYDIETEGYIGVNSCWAFDCGDLSGDGVGFKFGFKYYGTVDTSRKFTNCLSAFNAGNTGNGFDENTGMGWACLTMSMFNCTSYNNGGVGFRTFNNCTFGPKANVYKNNISYKDKRSMPSPTGLMTDSYNSWNTPPGVTISDADFISVDSAGISGPRKADGSLPDINFLKPASTSDLIDAGIAAGLPYYGSAPDLGWSETNYLKEVLVTGITVTGANNATSINRDNRTLQLNKTILPANATNQTVTWSLTNGTGQASINAEGMVTAIASGIVTAKASANDGSGVSGYCMVAISNLGFPSYLNNFDDCEFSTFLLPGKIVIISDCQHGEILCSLYNIYGVLMHHQEALNIPIEMDISAYPSGAYIIVLYVNQKLIPLKVVIP
jgi:hypothetical protein